VSAPHAVAHATRDWRIGRARKSCRRRRPDPAELVTNDETAELQDLARRSVSRRFARHYAGFFRGCQREHERQPTAKTMLYSYRVVVDRRSPPRLDFDRVGRSDAPARCPTTLISTASTRSPVRVPVTEPVVVALPVRLSVLVPLLPTREGLRTASPHRSQQYSSCRHPTEGTGSGRRARSIQRTSPSPATTVQTGPGGRQVDRSPQFGPSC
jgi:hypothetical protein